MNDPNEEEDFCFYGTPVATIDDGSVAKRKPIGIENQIATDEHGRRRFHGAFTGGFSAGYFNSVATMEGWLPGEFKSSRSEKAEQIQQKAVDFMDSEDMGEFGIAPTVIRTTDDFSDNNQKRRKRVCPSGSIPFEPVLCQLLEGVKDTVGVRLLRKMGWKPGQGVGPRLKKTEKRVQNKQRVKVYGCELPDELKKKCSGSESDSDPDPDCGDITFAPDDYDPYICNPKSNRQGIGYSGLQRNLDLLRYEPSSSSLTIRERNKKKFTISGQAFGVGAFEEDDEDVYDRHDMSRYDFELDNVKDTKDDRQNKSITEPGCLEGFTKSKQQLLLLKQFPAPELPKNFVARHGVQQSRFAPLPKSHQLYAYDQKNKNAFKGTLSADTRGKLLKEPEVIVCKNFPAQNESKVINTCEEKPELSANTSERFKPFASDPEKQKRYELFVKSTNKKAFCLEAYQPFGMTKSDRERERYEFEQADRLYNQTSIFDKFVVAQKPDNLNDPLAEVEKSDLYACGTGAMRDAVKMKMFGSLTRKIEDWCPDPLLCKRFNVPETKNVPSNKPSWTAKKPLAMFDYVNAMEENKKRPVPCEKMEPNANVICNEGTKPMNVTDQTKNKPELVKQKEVNLLDPIDTKSNMDLYNSIFNDSSSEDEKESLTDVHSRHDFTTNSNETTTNTQLEHLKKVVLDESYNLHKIENNRITLPISTKKGILSNVDFGKMKIEIATKSNEQIKTTQCIDKVDKHGEKVEKLKKMKKSIKSKKSKKSKKRDLSNKVTDKKKSKKHTKSKKVKTDKADKPKQN